MNFGSLLPTGADLGRVKNAAILGVGLVAGASLAYTAISWIQAQGIGSQVGRSYLSNTLNTLPNSPYRTFRSSIRFNN